MILASTTQKLQIVLGGAATTANSPVLVDYTEYGASNVSINPANATTNGTTPVDILGAPGASTQRRVNTITIYNADSAAIAVTVRLNDNGTTYDLISSVTLAKGSALQFTRENGWGLVDPSGGSQRELRAGWVQEFKESGVWYKPANCRFFMVECVGAGGGGAGGASAAPSTVIVCAGGGGGGCRVRQVFLASDLPSSVAVTVAPQANGGTGGVSALGVDGDSGGSSSFGTYLIGYGGGGGRAVDTSSANYHLCGGGGGGGTSVGGKTSSPVGGSAMLIGNASASVSDFRGGGCTCSSFLGGAGASGSVGNNAQSGSASFSYFSGGAGGGGCGIVVSTGAYGNWGQGSTPGQGSLLHGLAAASTPVRGLNGVKPPGYMGGGGAGGGALYLPSGNPVGLAGGDGAWPGGGGGGGGAAYTPSGTPTGGAGGKGGAGMVRVMGW